MLSVQKYGIGGMAQMIKMLESEDTFLSSVGLGDSVDLGQILGEMDGAMESHRAAESRKEGDVTIRERCFQSGPARPSKEPLLNRKVVTMDMDNGSHITLPFFVSLICT